jgi:5'-nucleotidase
MRIIVTNDDGFYSPSLAVLAEAASNFGEVLIMAPDEDHSATSLAITIKRPLTYQPVKISNFEAYRVNGTPADCVVLGLSYWKDADLVLSGINIGSNLGHEIWYSGTVAAAKQAAILGVKAAAFSLAINDANPPSDKVLPFLDEVLGLMLESQQPLLTNVNFPQEPRGLLWTYQSVRAYRSQVIEGEDPRGRKHYWLTAVPLSDPDEGSDRWVVEHGYVSLTPLRLNLTEEKWLIRLQQVGSFPK